MSTEDAAAAVDGFDAEPFLERVPASSTDFRPGECLASRDVSRRFSTRVSRAGRRGLFDWSEVFAADGDPSSLPELREVVLEIETVDCWGEPPLRIWVGLEAGEPDTFGALGSMRFCGLVVTAVLRERVEG
jgi:hypothetical protein